MEEFIIFCVLFMLALVLFLRSLSLMENTLFFQIAEVPVFHVKPWIYVINIVAAG